MDVLCREQFIAGDIVLTLDHSLKYNIGVSESCVVQGNGSLTIMSDDTDDTAYVCCGEPQNYTDYNSTVSFGFVNLSVAIVNVVFTGCGASLNSFNESFISLINSSTLCFSEFHSAVLVFFNSNLTLNGAAFVRYYGFAVISIDAQDSIFNNTTVTEALSGQIFSETGKQSIGSGISIIFTNKLKKFSNLVFSNCTFSHNNDITADGSCVDERVYETKAMCILKMNGASLSIIFNETQLLEGSNELLVLIKKSFFHINYGSISGGLVVLMLNTAIGKVVVSESTFFGNINSLPCPGSALLFYMDVYQGYTALNNSQPLLINDTHFLHQDGIEAVGLNYRYFQQTAVYITIVNAPKGSVDLKFIRVKFENNFAHNLSSCMLVTVQEPDVLLLSEVRVFLESLEVTRNRIGISQEVVLLSDTGLFTFDSVYQILINGSADFPSNFSRNFGSVIKTHNSGVHLSGHIVFSQNKAKLGSAFNMKESFLFFCHDLNLVMKENSVREFGGAIYVVNTFASIVPRCAIQIEAFNQTVVSFIGNEAGFGGSSIYGIPLYSCSMINHGMIQSTDWYYNNFNFSTSSRQDNHLDVSSKPVAFHLCKNSPKQVNHYPGQEFHLQLSALDKAGFYVRSFVNLSLILRFEKLSYSKSFLSKHVHVIHESKTMSCSTVNMTVHYFDE